jgi:PKD repeat protein
MIKISVLVYVASKTDKAKVRSNCTVVFFKSTVTLTTNNASGSDLETKINFITVPYPPVANFSASTSSPYVGQTVTFIDLTTNDTISWTWSFSPTTMTCTGGTNPVSQNPQVQFDAAGLYIVELTVTNAGGSDTETKTDYIHMMNPVIDLDITVYPEGLFIGTCMTPSLNSILPFSQLYNISPWNYSGSEYVVVIPNTNVVDWVLVELRDAASAANVTATTRMAFQAAFLLSNGKVVGMDGYSILHFNNYLTQQLFVVIWHRNHLGVMTSGFVTESGGIYSYDFSTGATQAYGSASAHKQIGTGVWGMNGGDGNRDGNVLNSDKTPLWETQSGTHGYLESDYNLYSQSDNKDKDDIWEPTLGTGSLIPD